MDRLVFEALADAITHFTGYNDPASPLWVARNPFGLRPTKPEHPFDEFGNRIFRSVLDGLQSAHFDLHVKLTGRLSPEATLTDLATAYGRKPTEAAAWAKWLRSALKDPTISARTEIRRFIEEQ
jgi:hypothetical protein